MGSNTEKLTEAPDARETHRRPVHLGDEPSQAPDRRELLRVGSLVQGPSPELVQTSVRLRQHGLDAQAHRPW